MVQRRKTEKLKQLTENMMKKQEKALLDDYAALFFCTSEIPLNVRQKSVLASIKYYILNLNIKLKF